MPTLKGMPRLSNLRVHNHKARRTSKPDFQNMLYTAAVLKAPTKADNAHAALNCMLLPAAAHCWK
jgi:hypothetical protein